MRGCNSGTGEAELYLVHREAAAVREVGNCGNASRSSARNVSDGELSSNRRFGAARSTSTGRLLSPSVLISNPEYLHSVGAARVHLLSSSALGVGILEKMHIPLGSTYNFAVACSSPRNEQVTER